MNVYQKIVGVLHVCRACLTLSKEVQLIFGENQNELVSILQALSIEIIDSDILPRYLCMSCVEKIKSFHSFVEMFKNSQKLIQEAIQSGERNMIKNEIEGRHEWDSSEIIDCDSPSPPSFQEAVDTAGGIKVKKESDRWHKIGETSQTSIENGDFIATKETGPSVSQCNNVSIKSEFKTHQEPVEGPVETFAHTSRATILQDLFAQEQQSGQEEQDGDHIGQEQAYVPEQQGIQAEHGIEEQRNDDGLHANLYDCQFCIYNFSGFKKYYQHLVTHRAARTITCAYCEGPPEVFDNVRNYGIHIGREHKLLFTCDHCNTFPFESFYSFWSHMKSNHHKSSLRSVFPIPLGCSKEDALYPWEEIDSKKSLCPYCSKRILDPSRFRYHLWTHFSQIIGMEGCYSCGELFFSNNAKSRHFQRFPNCRLGNPLPSNRKRGKTNRYFPN